MEWLNINVDRQIIQIGNVCPTKTRTNPNQGRVYDPLGIAPALNCKGGGNLEPHIIDDTLRCRKLTPLECFRLMGFTDEDFEKVKTALNKTFYKRNDRSNSQLYKLAGNSISVPMLEHIFCQMFDDENEIWIWKGWWNKWRTQQS